jgi:hypothetical protein
LRRSTFTLLIIICRPSATNGDLTARKCCARSTELGKQPPAYKICDLADRSLEWVRQTYDGRMDLGATTNTTVEDLTGRKPLTLREWVVRYRDSILAVGAQAAKGSLKE